nr:MAG: hypothetical protein [Skomarfal virus 25]
MVLRLRMPPSFCNQYHPCGPSKLPLKSLMPMLVLPACLCVPESLRYFPPGEALWCTVSMSLRLNFIQAVSESPSDPTSIQTMPSFRTCPHSLTLKRWICPQGQISPLKSPLYPSDPGSTLTMMLRPLSLLVTFAIAPLESYRFPSLTHLFQLPR